MVETDLRVNDAFIAQVNPGSCAKKKPKAGGRSGVPMVDGSVEEGQTGSDKDVIDKGTYEDFYKKLYYNFFKEPSEYPGSSISQSKIY